MLAVSLSPRLPVPPNTQHVHPVFHCSSIPPAPAAITAKEAEAAGAPASFDSPGKLPLVSPILPAMALPESPGVDDPAGQGVSAGSSLLLRSSFRSVAKPDPAQSDKPAHGEPAVAAAAPPSPRDLLVEEPVEVSALAPAIEAEAEAEAVAEVSAVAPAADTEAEAVAAVAPAADTEAEAEGRGAAPNAEARPASADPGPDHNPQTAPVAKLPLKERLAARRINKAVSTADIRKATVKQTTLV